MTTALAAILLALAALRLRLSWVRWWAERAPEGGCVPTRFAAPTDSATPQAAIVLTCERE